MIWLIGNKGMLGTEIERLLVKSGLEYAGSDREVDITDAGALDEFAARLSAGGRSLDWIVNCSAYTAVDRAEDEHELCYRLNRDGVANIARTAGKYGAALLHISTDYVFDGNGNRPYREDEPRNPQTLYGKSKASGEAELERIGGRYIILRTAWLYGHAGNNFVKTMVRLLSERDEVKVVNDQKGSPTYARDLAEAILSILRYSMEPKWGVYHFTNDGETTWYSFTTEIRKQALDAAILQRAGTVVPIRSEEYPSKVKRPAYSVLSKDKIRQEFGITIRPWQEGLREYLLELKEHEAEKGKQRV